VKIDDFRLKRYIEQGRKYLDALWQAKEVDRTVPWDDGRIRLWLAPRLGRPPWLCFEIWQKYAADRKAAEKAQVAPEPVGKGKDPEPERKPHHEAHTHAHKGSRK
jgi:hypothetical protein